MDPKHWNQIEEIYCSALACPVEQRPQFLQDRCGGDPQLRREVESLLQADASAGSFLGLADLEAQVEDLAAESPATAAGTVLGHYQILSQIAAGGMGEVYLAVDQRLNRQIALKVLPAEFTQDVPRVRRLLREAKMASSLNHPNIITVYEIGSTGGSHFIASEFIEGTTVRRLLKSAIPLVDAVDIALQCAAALGAAHKSGITHRDVKPENIMVRPDGLVKVLDFGLAVQMDNSSRDPRLPNKTESGVVVGTPRYMSPEQARGQKLDSRTDIFSLGAVLYEMTAGVPPFPGATTAEVFAQLLSSDPKPLSEYHRHLPVQLQQIVAKAMAKDRELRYQTMAAFTTDLRVLLTTVVDTGGAGDLAAQDNTVATPSAAAPVKNPRRRYYAFGRAAIMLGAAAAVLAGGHWISGRLPSPGSPHILPITSFSGSKDHATFSPDGTQIAFAWDGGKAGNRDIYVKVVGSGDPLRITTAPEDDWLPAWSPDGRFIAFSRSSQGNQSVYLVPALGGQERKVTEGGVGIAWWPDSRSLVIASAPPPQDSGGLVLLSLDTGERRQLTTPAPFADSLPAVSPDGQTIAFIRSLTRSSREVFAVPARGGPAREITFDHRPVFGVTWTADSRQIVYSSNRGGGESLWRVRATGGTPERALVGLQSVFYPSISRKGDRLVYTEDFLDTNIYRYSASGFGSRGLPGRFGNPAPLIASSREDGAPAFSPDGQRIAFVSKRTGTEEIWISDREGGRLVQLTSFSGFATGTPRWSPDGRFIAFDTRAGGSPDIYVIASEGGAPRRLTSEPSADTVPSWSSDGKWIYFISNRSGADQLWRMPSSGGPAAQITHSGARDALEGHDGRIYFVKTGVWGIWSVRPDGSGEAVVPGLEHAGRTRLWGVHNQGIYFVSKKESPPYEAQWYSFATGKVSTLFKFDKEPFWNGPGLALSPDGRQLLLVFQDQHVDDLMLIEDFR